MSQNTHQKIAALFILGPPESGASALETALCSMGFASGDARELAAINDAILSANGSDWLHPPSVPLAIAKQAKLAGIRERARDWLSTVSGNSAVVLADPRLALTAPFWRSLVDKSYTTIMVRSPASLRATHEANASLWQSYMEHIFDTLNESYSVIGFELHERRATASLRALADALQRADFPTNTAALDRAAKAYAKTLSNMAVETDEAAQMGDSTSADTLYWALRASAAGDDHSRREAVAQLTGPIRKRLESERLNIADLSAKIVNQNRLHEDTLADHEQTINETTAAMNAAQARLDALTRELDAIVKSRAWQMSAPLRFVRRQVGKSIRALSRRKITLRVVPAHQVQFAGSEDQFVATGSDPHVLLTPESVFCPLGWTRLRLTLKTNDGIIADPVLYTDSSDLTSPPSEQRLPAPIDGIVDAIVFIPPRTRVLRLDPMSRAGCFEIADVTLQQMSVTEASLRSVLERFETTDDAIKSLGKIGRVLRSEGPGGVINRLRANRAPNTPAPYSGWVERFDTLTDVDRALIEQRIVTMRHKPLISLVMPVYNVDEKWLRKALDSVANQLYPYWELCIADDRSSKPHIKQVLNEYAQHDRRIKVVFRETNGHISRASNSALELATGQFVALLDHDDELAAHALYVVAEEVNAHPDAVLIYSDEDKIDETGKRFDPYFKSDWNPDLFYGHNMISHLGVYRRDVLTKIGGFRVGLEGSQDYDLALRTIEQIRSEQIRHIPHILYHWRAIVGSVALGPGEKNYAHDAARRAIGEHLVRTKAHGKVGSLPTNGSLHRVEFEIPSPRPLVSIIIPTRDGYQHLRRCIRSVSELTSYENYELIVVDNGSSEPRTLSYLQSIEHRADTQVLRDPQPFNFSALNNAAAKQARGDILVFLNDDVEVITPEWLSVLVSHACRPAVGAVGAMLYYPDNTIQHAGVVLGIANNAGHAFKHFPRGATGHIGRAMLTQNYSAVTAACMAIRKAIFDEIGGFDSELAVAYNDVDLCLRASRAGYRTVWTPHAELYHHESQTRGSDQDGERLTRLQHEASLLHARWSDVIEFDPYYNANLTLNDESFALSFPSRAQKPWLTAATSEVHNRGDADKEAASSSVL